jgi:hypothetical protein
VAIRKIEPGENFSSINASMTYSYKSVQSNVFDKIEDVIVNEVSAHQFIGEHNIINEIEKVWSEKEQSWIKNPKVDLIDIYGLTLRERQIERLIESNGKFYTDAALQNEFNVDAADPFTLYALGHWQKTVEGSEGPGYRPGYSAMEFMITGYIDFYNKDLSGNPMKYEGRDSVNFKAQINNELISVDELGIYHISKPGRLNHIELGNGVVGEIAYQIRNIDYRIESNETYGALVKARLDYDAAVKQMEQWHIDNDEPSVNLDNDNTNDIVP